MTMIKMKSLPDCWYIRCHVSSSNRLFVESIWLIKNLLIGIDNQLPVGRTISYLIHVFRGMGNGQDMLIFQLHLIPNSMQALHALSHSEITFWKAPSQYQHVSLKQLKTVQLSRMMIYYCLQVFGDKIFGM